MLTDQHRMVACKKHSHSINYTFRVCSPAAQLIALNTVSEVICVVSLLGMRKLAFIARRGAKWRTNYENQRFLCLWML